MTTLNNDGGTDDGVRGSTASHDKNGVIGVNNDTTARNAATPEGSGVMGFTQVPDGAGVFGLHMSNGVGVAGFGHPTGIGVVGSSAPAGAKGGDGVLGVTNSEHRNGVVGLNDSTTARAANDAGGNGIFGFTQVPDGAGVFGAHASTGIGVAGLGLIGVSGGSVNGFGVVGASAPTGAKGGDGVHGFTNSELRNGMYGLNISTTARNNSDPAGNGVFGYSNVPDGAGVLGGHGGSGFGVVGTGYHGVTGSGTFGVVGSGTAIGVWGIAQGSGWAGYFAGPVALSSITPLSGPLAVTGDVAINGNLTVTGDVFLANRDLAERFEVESAAQCVPGMLMVVADSGALVPCTGAYDKRAVGVVAGAGALKPAVTLGRADQPVPTAAISLVGTAYCWVDADHGAVAIGDLLTSSPTPGHAMKAADPARALGAMIGKALRPLREGKGLVPIVIALQ